MQLAGFGHLPLADIWSWLSSMTRFLMFLSADRADGNAGPHLSQRDIG